MAYTYDIFLSYRHCEPDVTRTRELFYDLKSRGYSVAIDGDDFAPNQPFLTEMERGIRESRFTLAIVTPRYLESGNCEEEAAICKMLDMGGRTRRLIPLIFEKAEVPIWMSRITSIDFTDADPLVAPMEQLFKALGEPLSQSVTSTTTSANPYDPWHPVQPVRFVGREEKELRQARVALEAGRSISIVGDRRIGKSSLLLKLRQELDTAGRTTVLISGQRKAGTSYRHFVEEITSHTLPQDASPDAAAEVLEAWAVRRAHGAIKPVVLVDEADHLAAHFPIRLFERMRGMLDKVELVLATAKPLRAIDKEANRTSPLATQLEMVQVGLLERTATDAILSWTDIWQEGDLELMRYWAGEHPCFLHMIAYHLLVARQTDGDKELALDRFLAQAHPLLETILGHLTAVERRDLETAANGTPVKRRSLRTRGLLTSSGQAFGHILKAYLHDEL